MTLLLHWIYSSYTNVTALQGRVYLVLDVHGLLVYVKNASVVLTQLLNGRVWNIAAAYKLLAQACGNPFRVLDVALAAWKLPDGVWVDEIQLEVTFQDAPNGHPVDAGTLHRYLRNAIVNKRVAQVVKLLGQNSGLELNFLTVGFVNTNKYIIFVNIETTDISHRLGI